MPTKKSTGQQKWTAAQIEKHILNIRKFTEQAKKKAKKGHTFVAINPEEIRKKFKRINSPLFGFMTYSSVLPGGTMSFTVGVYNPDPVGRYVHVHQWVGSGNADPVMGTFLSNVDARFPRLTIPSDPGTLVNPSGNATFTFSIKIPASIEPSNYIGNCALFAFNNFDQGFLLDRSCFVFKVG